MPNRIRYENVHIFTHISKVVDLVLKRNYEASRLHRLGLSLHYLPHASSEVQWIFGLAVAVALCRGHVLTPGVKRFLWVHRMKLKKTAVYSQSDHLAAHFVGVLEIFPSLAAFIPIHTRLLVFKQIIVEVVAYT